MGIVTLAFLPDTPANAWFLKSEEKAFAVQRLADNQTGVERSKVGIMTFLSTSTSDWEHAELQLITD